MAVVTAAPGAREPDAGTEDRRCQRAAEGSLCSAGVLANVAGPDAERLSSAAFDRSSERRRVSAAVTCWRVKGAEVQAEVQVEVDGDGGVGTGAGAGAGAAGRGAAGLAGGGLQDCLTLLFFAAADAGRQTACWSDCGGAQAGKGGIVCHRCSGTGACSKAAFVMGCWPLIKRVHVVVFQLSDGRRKALVRPLTVWSSAHRRSTKGCRQTATWCGQASA